MGRKGFQLDFNHLYERNQAGESLNSIGAEIGLTAKQLKSALSKRGFRFRAERDYEGLHRRYIAGERIEILAREHGVSDTALRHAFYRRGLDVRTRSDNQRHLASLRTADERLENARAAHAAVRGAQRTHDELVRRAITRQARPDAFMSAIEAPLLDILHDRGIVATPQLAIDKYNVDIAFASVAVEVYGGSWHNSGRAAQRFMERTHTILNRGWHLIIIWVEQPHYPLTVEAANYLITMAEFARRNPSAPCQYRVIRGTGEVVIRGCANDHDFPMKLPRISRQHIWCEHLRAADEAIRML